MDQNICDHSRNHFTGNAAVTLLLWFSLICISEISGQSDSVRRLEEVTIAGSYLPDIQTITPVQRLNQPDFKKYGAYNVADAIRNFSGVYIKDYGGLGGLKTISVRSLSPNHTAVQHDGVPATDTQNGQIDLGKTDLSNIQNITLYVGQPGDILLPASSFASASLLVINSLPSLKDTLLKNTINLAYNGGSFGLINPEIHVQKSLSKSWLVRFSSHYQQAHGRYRYKVDGDGSDTLSTRRNGGIRTLRNDLTLLWQKRPDRQFFIRSNYYYSSRGLPGAVIFYNPHSSQHLWNHDFFVQSSYQAQWKKLRLLTNGKFSNDKVRYIDPDFLNNSGGLDQQYRQRTAYASATASCHVLPQLELSYAADATYSTLHTNIRNSSYPTRITILNAFSGHFRYGRVEILGTLLNTHINEYVKPASPIRGNRSVWSPSVAATVRPFRTSDVRIRAFYKHIFRNPTFNDLYYTRAGNRSLQPEYAIQYNLGATVTKAIGHQVHFVTLSADAYYNRIKDKIIAIPNKDLFTWSMFNLGETDTYGLDLGIKTALTAFGHFRNAWSINYTHQQALDVTDPRSTIYLSQIPYTPKHNIYIHTGLERGKWGVFVNQSYTSARYSLPENIPDNHVAGFALTDLSGTYRFRLGSSALTATLHFNNLLNERYYLIRSYPMPGRSTRFSIQISI